VGAARVAKDQHWAADVVGGWLAGGVVASAATLAYEMGKGEEQELGTRN